MVAPWETLNEVIKMDAKHDEVLAATSHLPHLIAFSLVNTLAGEDDNKKYSGMPRVDFGILPALRPVIRGNVA